MLEPSPQNRNLLAMQEQSDGTADEHDERKREQQPFVALHVNAKESQVADDRSAGSRHGQQRACPYERRRQQKNGRDELHDARADASPHFYGANGQEGQIGVNE